MSNTKLTGLPVPPTDSIFAVIAEETGIFGTSILILLYCILIWRGVRIAINAPDALGSMLAGGLTLWIAMEAFINMGVMVGLLPFAGNALPFISAGGSSLMVTLTSIGILLNISRLSNQAEGIERKAHAFNGVRRGDSRRRQSRAGRSASTR
jgi:cell division protein FtsW